MRKKGKSASPFPFPIFPSSLLTPGLYSAEKSHRMAPWTRKREGLSPESRAPACEAQLAHHNGPIAIPLAKETRHAVS